ncbi:cytochrome c oxidase assembly protein [Falsiroseomonas sp. HC035]|uniref:cytochrome c oxidase assembly protein n=1 Tax=Falsiroseomonas sp. HC035 TaxID=3390999 RepID=UPI003D3101F8
MLALAALAAILLMPGKPLAHAASSTASLLPWTFEPWVVLPLAVGGALAALGGLRLARRASPRGLVALRRRLAMLALGWAVLAVALVSPLAAAGHVSFSAHMLQHEVVMLLAAPALVLGRPLGVIAWGLPGAARAGFAGMLRSPPVRRLRLAATAAVAATLAQAAVLWLWHAPLLFELALRHPAWHAAQHLSFLLAGLAFWAAMLRRCPPTLAGRGLAALCLLATSIVSGALGALMAISASPWYATYARLGLTPQGLTSQGLTPAEDQQLAGLLMWVPGGLVHAGAALVLLGLALRPGTEAVHARQS